jgi:hypothetical protein
MPSAFDWSTYFRTPRLSAPGAIALGKMLREAKPKALPPLAERASRQLDEAVRALELSWWEAERKGGSKRDARPYDRRLDNLWAALYARLRALLALPEGAHERERAQALLEAVFAGGLGFLKLPYLAEHSESQRRLALIESEGVAGEMRELAGAALIEALRAAHDEYGRVLGITAVIEAPALSLRVSELLREMQAALRAYTLQLAAYAAAGDEAFEAVRTALEPIDALRARARRRTARAASPGAEGPSEGGDTHAPAAAQTTAPRADRSDGREPPAPQAPLGLAVTSAPGTGMTQRSAPTRSGGAASHRPTAGLDSAKAAPWARAMRKCAVGPSWQACGTTHWAPH